MARARRAGRHRRRRGRSRKGQHDHPCEGIRLGRCKGRETGRSRRDALPSRLDLEGVRLDERDAVGRAGAPRSRSGHSGLCRFPAAGRIHGADHAAANHDSHGRVRGDAQGVLHARLHQGTAAGSVPLPATAPAHLSTGLDSCLLELRDCTGGLHRGENGRRAVREVCRGPHLRPARHAPVELPAAASRQPRRR